MADTTRPITAAIQETVTRLQQAEREAAQCLSDLQAIGVSIRRTPEGRHWELSADVAADKSTSAD